MNEKSKIENEDIKDRIAKMSKDEKMVHVWKKPPDHRYL